MHKDAIYSLIISDIKRLLDLQTSFPYLSGNNALTDVRLIDSGGQFFTGIRTSQNPKVMVRHDHLKTMAEHFSSGRPVDVNAAFGASGSVRQALEAVLARLPHVGWLPAGAVGGLPTKSLIWFDTERNTLGETFDATAAIAETNLSSSSVSSMSIELVAAAFAKANDQAGLRLPIGVSTRFVTALLTKRFLVLTGLAGSGKTKIAEAFAMWLCASPEQYRIVAVGADWTSNENLLGYADALQTGVYRPPVNGALELILRAHADTTNPYFLILDEMNLSHVERYFADFLSAMESSNAPLSLHGVAAGLQAGGVGGAGGVEVPSSVALPDNLFIIGTVNVDETTYMFSPKVLDRANVIEFRATAAQMDAFLDDPAGIDLDGLASQGVGFAAAFVERAQADADIAALVDTQGTAVAPQLKADLLQVFDALAGVGAEFGFRTAKEIARFMVLHKELSGTDWQYQDALDAQVVQKLMPKLHGSARKLDAVLKALDTFATQHALVLTGEKVKRMQERLSRDGFTSFAEA